MFNLFTTMIYLDYGLLGQVGFQDASTSIMQGIINLHHHIFFLLIITLIFVGVIFLQTYKLSYWKKTSPVVEIISADYFNKQNNKNNKLYIQKLKREYNLNVNHGVTLEIIWTIIPSLVLLLIVGPSFALLYAMDAFVDPAVTVKILAHQWYWTFEYSDFLNNHSLFSKNIHKIFNKVDITNINYNFDSYMIATSDLKKGDLRLLEVDNALYLPTYSRLRLDVTSDDVMHCFAVPSLGVKVDAIPGRLNIAYAEILREGIFFGQCSELCGVNHGYMPVKVIAVDYSNYINYIILNSEIRDSQLKTINRGLFCLNSSR